MNKFKELKEECYLANMKIPEHNLAIFTFGNASSFDPSEKVFAIKPSGMPYNKLKPEDIVIVDLKGNKVDGKLNPSSDTPTHAVLYNFFSDICGIVHAHSTYATSWAQSCRSIPIYGTTHADHLTFDVPVTEIMNDEMIKGDYEYQTGFQIVDALKDRKLSHREINMILVACHGPFTWGATADQAVYNAVVLEELAKMASITEQNNKHVKRLKDNLIAKHYERKHGEKSYYGQEK